MSCTIDYPSDKRGVQSTIMSCPARAGGTFVTAIARGFHTNMQLAPKKALASGCRCWHRFRYRNSVPGGVLKSQVESRQTSTGFQCSRYYCPLDLGS
jgi:hypothetical protein